MRSKEPGESLEEKKFWCKTYRSKSEIVAAICDEDLLGKEIRHGNLSIRISKSFYGGRLIDSKMAERVMNASGVGNLIGKNIIKLALDRGFITQDNIIDIDGAPHAQFVKI